ncbi:MAG: hypothetical protein JWM11_7401 [Planctomycetaceae bacterium]|nr:hypothetical protein [Planctomycetaceae bacterium]
MDQNTRETLIRLANPTIANPIAELVLEIEFPDGRREVQHCRIGCPEQIGEFIVCSVQGIGPVPLSSPAVTENSFQSLNMAIKGMQHDLNRFVQRHSCQLALCGSPITLAELNELFFLDGYLEKIDQRIKASFSPDNCRSRHSDGGEKLD